MALGLTCEAKDGVFHLVGSIDEFADFSALLAAPGATLRLNLRGVRMINSLGLRRLIALMAQLGDRDVACYDCPPVFLESVNVVPISIGGQSKVGRIKSAYLPMTCADLHKTNVVVLIKDLQFGKDGVQLPERDCNRCGMPLSLDSGMEGDDVFFFLTAQQE